MATATSDILALTQSYRVAQARRAAALAVLVSAYWRSKVDVNDPSSIERWLDIMVPRILSERDTQARFAALFGEKVRALELPGSKPFVWEPPSKLDAAAVRTSLSVTGPVAVRKKLATYDKMTTPELERRLSLSEARDITRDMLQNKATIEATKTVTGATVRHAMGGGREVLVEGSKQDTLALGWVRVTKANPCYFCAMLASRGLEKGGWFDDDSFDASDPRFVGSGTAKVHDNCGCSMKPVYSLDDPVAERTREFEDLWLELSGGKGGALENFRKNYTERFHTS